MAQLTSLLRPADSEDAGAEGNIEPLSGGEAATIEAGAKHGALQQPTNSEGPDFGKINIVFPKSLISIV